MEDIYHWSDWATQPGIRIACTQSYHFPWNIRKDLPDRVHEAPVKGNESILYTFAPLMVNCKDCLKLETLQECIKNSQNIRNRFKNSGLAWDEFIKKDLEDIT